MKQAIKRVLSMMGFAAYLFVFGIFFSNANSEPTSEKIETKLDKLNEQLLNFRNFLSSLLNYTCFFKY